MNLRHASSVAVDGRGVLILGQSGAGKSSLALQLVGLGAELVGDDQIALRRDDDTLTATAAPGLSGKIEARGLGILRLKFCKAARIVIVVDLDRATDTRLPHPIVTEINSVALPLIAGANRPNLTYEIMALLRYGKEPPLIDPEMPIA